MTITVFYRSYNESRESVLNREMKNSLPSAKVDPIFVSLNEIISELEGFKYSNFQFKVHSIDLSSDFSAQIQSAGISTLLVITLATKISSDFVLSLVSILFLAGLLIGFWWRDASTSYAVLFSALLWTN